MLRNLNKSAGGRRILGTPHVGIIASQIISETAIGDSGAGLLYDEALVNSGKQLRLYVTSAPSSGTLFAHENGSFELDGAADGSYTIGYQYFVDNVLGGSDTATVTVGAANASAADGGVGASFGIGSGGRARGSGGLAPTVFVKSAGIYEQVSSVYVKQAGLYQQAGVFVKQINSWMQL